MGQTGTITIAREELANLLQNAVANGEALTILYEEMHYILHEGEY